MYGIIFFNDNLISEEIIVWLDTKATCRDRINLSVIVILYIPKNSLLALKKNKNIITVKARPELHCIVLIVLSCVQNMGTNVTKKNVYQNCTTGFKEQERLNTKNWKLGMYHTRVPIWLWCFRISFHPKII